MTDEPLRQGGIIPGTFRFAEPEGCEWFIPYAPDPERRARIYSEIAKWYDLPDLPDRKPTIHVNLDTEARDE